MLPLPPPRQLLIWPNRKNIAHTATFFRFGGFGTPHLPYGEERPVTELDADATNLRQNRDDSGLAQRSLQGVDLALLAHDQVLHQVLERLGLRLLAGMGDDGVERGEALLLLLDQ